MGMHHEKPLFVHVIPLGSMPGTLLPHSLSPTLYEDCSQTCDLRTKYGGNRGCQRFKLCWIRIYRSNIRTRQTLNAVCPRLRKNFILLVFNSLEHPDFNQQRMALLAGRVGFLWVFLPPLEANPASCLTRSPRHSTGRVSS